MISVDGAVAAHPAGACCANACKKCAPKRRAKTRAKTSASPGVVYLDATATTPAQRSRPARPCWKRTASGPAPADPFKQRPDLGSPKPPERLPRPTSPACFEGEAEGVTVAASGTPVVVDGVGFAEGPRWTVGRSVVNDLHDAGRWACTGTCRTPTAPGRSLPLDIVSDGTF